MLFFGRGEWATRLLEHLLENRNVEAVVVPLEHISDPITDFAAKNSLSVIIHDSEYPGSLYHAVYCFKPNLCLMFNYDYKIPSSVIGLPTYGFFNIHPGKLPEYRGPTPIEWQLHNGEKNITVTLHMVSDKFDRGAIIDSADVPVIKIESQDTVFNMVNFKRLLMPDVVKACIGLIDRNLPIILAGNARGIKQDKSKAKYWKRWK